MSATPSKNTKRKEINPPAVVPEGMSLFDYLVACDPPLHHRIVDIALSQTTTPAELRDDARQEIFLTWSQISPDVARFQPGQIASYAHMMAKHVALRLRREIGAAVRLPGSAFRKRRDGSSYVTPGVLAAPVSWGDVEGWFDTGDLPDHFSEAGLSFSELPEDALIVSEEDQEAIAQEELERKTRLAHLETFKPDETKPKDDPANRGKLSMREFEVMRRLIEGESYAMIMSALNVKRGVLIRDLNRASERLAGLADDESDDYDTEEFAPDTDADVKSAVVAPEAPVPKKRGRPPKVREDALAGPPKPPAKRGRPRKNPLPADTPPQAS